MNKERGIVHSVGEERQWKSGNGSSLVFVLKCPGNRYDNYLPMTLKGEQVSECPSVGTEVEVEFFLNGRLWKPDDGAEKCFVDLAVKSISVLTGEPSGAAVSNAENDSDSDIPF